MGLFSSRSSSSQSNTTYADQDNLAGDAGAVVIKGGRGDVVLSDPGSVEAIGQTIELVRDVTDGIFGMSERSANDAQALASQAVSQSADDGTEIMQMAIQVGLPVIVGGLVLWRFLK